MEQRPRCPRVWLLLACCAGLFGCGSANDEKDDVQNPSFDDWCDQHLCDWQIDEGGTIAHTRTWHEQDLAVSLLATGTRIWQELELDDSAAKCILFDTIADVAASALVSLELDFNSDGIVDRRQEISTLRWKSVPFTINTPVAYDGLIVSVVKRGGGRAVLAQMRAVPQRDCPGDSLTLSDNSTCSEHDVCSSGRCEAGRCQPCSPGGCTSLTPGTSSE